MEKTLSKRYALALYQEAQAQNCLDEVNKDILDCIDILKESVVFNKFLINASFTKEQQMEVIKNLFENKIQKITFRFLNLLLMKSRINMLSTICFSFVKIFNQKNNIVNVAIIAPYHLDTEQQNLINSHLSKKFNKNIVSIVLLDESLIGGIKIKMDDKLYDYSIKTKLEQFKHSIIHS